MVVFEFLRRGADLLQCWQCEVDFYVLMRGPRTVYKFMEFVPEFVFASGFCS